MEGKLRVPCGLSANRKLAAGRIVGIWARSRFYVRVDRMSKHKTFGTDQSWMRNSQYCKNCGSAIRNAGKLPKPRFTVPLLSRRGLLAGSYYWIC
jgi:hypothetical protein